MPLLDYSEPPWPMFGKICVIVEGFIYYSQYITKVIIHDLSKWFPEASLLSNVHDTIMLLAGVMSFVMGYMADDAFGKYTTVLVVYMFAGLAPSLGLFAIHFPFLSMHWRTYLFIASLYLWFPIFSVEATRVALISEQFKIPQSLRSLKMFYFCFMLSRYAGSGVAGVLLHTEQLLGSDTIQLTIKTSILLFVVVCYILLLLMARSQIRKKRVEFGVVDSVAACIATALYNRAFARKKMHANTTWIDYADAKYYKETKDSALQLVQMSLIFMPFSLFFALNEFLDVIWMEQNEWIKQDDADFFSNLSMITIYHAVDVFLIPLFEYMIEFLAPKKCNLILTDLQLIGSSIFLLGLAYLSTTVLQSIIENGHVPHDPSAAACKFFNSADINVTINVAPRPVATLKPGELYEFADVRSTDYVYHGNKFSISTKIRYLAEKSYELSTVEPVAVGFTHAYIITRTGVLALPIMKHDETHSMLELVSGVKQHGNLVVHLDQLKAFEDHHRTHASSAQNLNLTVPKFSDIQRTKISKGVWRISLYSSKTLQNEQNITVLPKTTYTVFIYGSNETVTFAHYASNNAQSVNILLALPQILLRSFADGIGKISTYYFTYTQSPRKLRATAFGVLYFAQYSFPGMMGMILSVWQVELTSFVLSTYTFIVFLALFLFIYFALRYEEI